MNIHDLPMTLTMTESDLEALTDPKQPGGTAFVALYLDDEYLLLTIIEASRLIRVLWEAEDYSIADLLAMGFPRGLVLSEIESLP